MQTDCSISTPRCRLSSRLVSNLCDDYWYAVTHNISFHQYPSIRVTIIGKAISFSILIFKGFSSTSNPPLPSLPPRLLITWEGVLSNLDNWNVCNWKGLLFSTRISAHLVLPISMATRHCCYNISFSHLSAQI